MPGENTEIPNVDETDNSAAGTQSTNASDTSTTRTVEDLNKKADDDLVAKLVEERLAIELKDIKAKLDKAYGARDEAKQRIAEFEKKEREAELQRLRDEGKHKEAYELQLIEKDATLEALRKENLVLTRDISVKDVLKTLSFKSENASNMAFREIVQNLVQDENGVWVHRSGVSIKDFVKVFAADEEFSFLFKSKANSGNGTSSTTSTNATSGSGQKSLFQLPQKEVLKMAAEGRLPKRH
jgi:hypothetical protein